MIAAMVLAAGRGTRFGGSKMLAPFGGRPMIRWSVEALEGAVDEITVVVPAGDQSIRSALDGLPVRFAVNERRDEGLSSSLTAGARAVGAECEAMLVALGDQPGISPDVAALLIERWREGGAPAVVPVYADGRGHPVLFDRRCFGALMELHGDVGARVVLDALGGEVALVRVPGRRPADVDTVDALERLERSQRPGT